ncbi:FHA domain-containing protein [Corallococcus coralloides DSM 2259]|uniref:FHA domain-containing protein n=1 Tax=Corallococcus coralloides (strain ATCC 25202 / DSM 2259 / NBRC 100086 / M2) TaxID=1144275 RepID=H8MQN0_CORCM|nr:AgmX/PglI C-terminal domain-containing protein [Corallococcus coralloides]AFE03938.1 FHA domain-containing protein [Corallococcus coralloides DSM 2259]
MSGQPSVLQVVILRDGLLVGTEVFVPGTYALGSDASSDLRLDDASVSPRHALLYFQNGRTAIQDAGGGTSGVFVNGHQVTACEIRSVDEVLCGPFVLKTRILNQRPVETKPQPPPEVAALLGGAGAPPAAPPHGGNGAPHAFGPANGFAPQNGAQAAHAQQAAFAQQQAQQAALAQQAAYAQQQAQQAALAQQQAQQAALAQQQAQRAAQAQQAAHAQQQAQQAAYAQQQAQQAALAQQQAQQAAYAQQQAQQATYAQQQAQQAALAQQQAQQAAYAQQQAQQAALAQQQAQQAAYAQQQAQQAALAQQQAQQAAKAAHAQQAAHAQPSSKPAPAPAVPAGTVPSARRRPPSEVMPSLLAVDDLLADVDTDVAAPTSGPLVLDAAPASRPTHAPKIGPGKGAAQLYMELYWGAVRRDARRFVPDAKKPVKAAVDELAPMPLWGFTLPEGDDFTLAESVNGNYRLFVPPGTDVEKAHSDGRFAPVTTAALESDGSRRFVTLRDGAAARLTQGKMSLVAYAAPAPERVFVNPLKGLPWLTLFFLAIFGGGLGWFIATRPQGPATADFTQKNLPPVALRLIAPEPKKKEEAKKKLETLKKKEPAKDKPVVAEKAPPKPVKEVQVPKAVAAAPESKALKALAKLSAAGPATNDLLAAVDKLGSGPGSKNAKQTNYKLAGLIGKAPIANAGLGTFGLGGGGKGGGATLGAELLRGKGGGGIGALGAGGVGKGAVGGTVTRATARSISSTQGTVDREAVAKVINSHLNEVHGCYERALLKDPGLAGKVVLEWAIGLNGRVASAKTKSSTLRNASVEACILSSLKGWQFPAPKGGQVIITYPFLFNSVGY